MNAHPTISFSDSDMGLFSPDEIQQLIRIEFDRALRYKLPISLMVVEVDRLEYMHHLYGLRSKDEIQQSVLSLLRAVTRASDFLGCMVDDRIVAAFPHTPEPAAIALAGRLMQGVRKLEFEADGRALRATLSIGISSVEPSRALSFEEWVEAAEGALRFALDAGGDRFVQRKAVQDVIAELRQDLDEQAEVLAAVPDPPQVEGSPEAFVADQVRDLFHNLGESSAALAHLRRDVLSVVRAGMDVLREEALAQSARVQEQRVKLLEARVHKLKGVLDATEAELARVAAIRGVDPGVASVYRSVQGLDAGEADYGRKCEMLSLIFEANVELRKSMQRES